MEKTKKVAAINDLSGYGKCSLTVALPILTMFGLQCCPLPTAVLSNHTGFESFFFDDYTDKMERYYQEWVKLQLSFDCIYTGFLGSERQIDIVGDFIRRFKRADNLLLVDPVMGDNGRIYSTYSGAMCDKMKRLSAVADIVTPNVTEACILSGTPYKEVFKIEEIREIAVKIRESGAKKVVITGISQGEYLGNYLFEEEGMMCREKSVPCQYSGTGDLFASLLCGYVMNGFSLQRAVEKSARFVYDATLYSHQAGMEKNNGVAFEQILKKGFLIDEHEG